MSTPGYGILPNENTSHIVTPKDHYRYKNIPAHTKNGVIHALTIYLLCNTLSARTYHISLLCEDAIMETLYCHPPHWELHRSISLLSQGTLPEVVPGIDVLRQAKVCYLQHKLFINPKSMLKPKFTTYTTWMDKLAVFIP